MRVNATTSLSRMEVTCDMPGLTSRAGSALLTGLADALGLTDGLLSGLCVHSRAVRHQPGRVARDIAVMLADGGDALTDLGALRDQGVLFGEVASDATAYRCVERLDEEMLARIREVRAAARARAWGLGPAPRRLVLDIDATLLAAHSEKERAAGTYKGGFGFHPLLCFEAGSGEALAGILRPGNAGSNTAADHIEVLEAALAQLPRGAAGPGTLVRCDSGGASHAFLDAVLARGLAFSVGCDLTEGVRAAILALPESAWVRALDSAGDPREGAWVAELPLRALGLAGGHAGDLPPRASAPRGAALLQRLRRSPLPGHPHQPERQAHRAPRAGASLSRRHRGLDPQRQGLGAAQPALPRLGHERRLAGAGAHGHRPALLDAAAAARRHRARRLRTEAPALPLAARRRPDRASRRRAAPAPTALLALGADARRRLRAPASLALRLTGGRPLHKTQGAYRGGFGMPSNGRGSLPTTPRDAATPPLCPQLRSSACDIV